MLQAVGDDVGVLKLTSAYSFEITKEGLHLNKSNKQLSAAVHCNLFTLFSPKQRTYQVTDCHQVCC